MKRLLIFSTALMLCFASCSKDDTKPTNNTPGTNSLQESVTPTPCFNLSKDVAETNETVQLTSCSTNGFNYEWDFGDGTSSTIQDPTKVYDKSGTYTIKLKVLTKDKTKSAETSKTIKIGKKYLTKITVKQVPFTNSSGSAWDWGGYPDFIMLFGRSSQASYEYATPEKSDVKTSNLPFTWDLTTKNIVLTRENWNFGLFDQDVTEKEGVLGWKDINLSNQTNPIILTGASNMPCEIEIYWEIR